MTNREQFMAWFDKEFADYSPTEAMEMAWQASAELSEKRIAELELNNTNLKGLNRELCNDLASDNDKLAIAIEALEFYTKFSDRRITETADIALTKIKGE
jgi:hypothetical protein